MVAKNNGEIILSGHIFNLDSEDILNLYITHGVYGTRISKRAGLRFHTNQLSTLADYLTIKKNDLIFFFLERNIYGVGRAVQLVPNGGGLASICNFPLSYKANKFAANRESCLWPEQFDSELWTDELRSTKDIRWTVFFEHCPYFFRQALDMDEVLQSDVHGFVRQLRAFEGVSFIQLEDEEAQFLVDLLLRKNRNILNDPTALVNGTYPKENVRELHAQVRARGTELANYKFDLDSMILDYTTGNSNRPISHESALHAWLVYHLSRKTENISKIFGEWDLVLNQLPASPFKPIRYMDRIDVFGYVRQVLAEDFPPTVIKYKVIEMKPGQATDPTEEVNQVMKYVDWIAHNRAGGDYELVDAYLLASRFSDEVKGYKEEHARRSYIVPRRPYRTAEWDNLKLVRYSVDNEGKIRLHVEE